MNLPCQEFFSRRPTLSPSLRRLQLWQAIFSSDLPSLLNNPRLTWTFNTETLQTQHARDNYRPNYPEDRFPVVDHDALSSETQKKVRTHETSGDTPIGADEESSNIDLRDKVKNFAKSLSVSAFHNVETERSSQNAQKWNTLRQHQAKHRESFPTIHEELLFRAGEADKVHQKNQAKANEAQETQERAAFILAAAFEQVQRARVCASDDDTDLTDLKKEFQAMKKREFKMGAELRETKKSLENCRRELTQLGGRVAYLESFATETQQVALHDQQFPRTAAKIDQNRDALVGDLTPDLVNYTTFLEAEDERLTSKIKDLENRPSHSTNRKHLYSSDSDDDPASQRKQTTKRHKLIRRMNVSQGGDVIERTD